MFTFKPKISAKNNKFRSGTGGSKTPRVNSTVKKVVKKPVPNIFSAPSSPVANSPKSVVSKSQVDPESLDLDSNIEVKTDTEIEKVADSKPDKKSDKKADKKTDKKVEKKSWFSRIFGSKKSEKTDKTDVLEKSNKPGKDLNDALDELKNNVSAKSKKVEKKSGFLGFRKRKGSKLKLTIDETENKVFSEDDNKSENKEVSVDDIKLDTPKTLLHSKNYTELNITKIKLCVSDINNLYNKPFELLPSPGSDKAIIVSEILFNLVPGTGVFRNPNSPGVINVNYGSGVSGGISAIGNCIPKTFYDGINNNTWLFDSHNAFHHIVNFSKDIIGKNITISSLGDPIVGGNETSELYIHLIYRVFNLL